MKITMQIEVWRDYVIVIGGIIQVFLILVLTALSLILYLQINNFIKRGKQTVFNIEKKMEGTFNSPYYKAGSWIFGWLAEINRIRGNKEK